MDAGRGVAIVVGDKFFARSLTNIQTTYLKWYNDATREIHLAKTKKFRRFQDLQQGKTTLAPFGIDMAFEIPEGPGALVHDQAIKDKHTLKLDLPIKFRSGPRSTNASPLSGELSFNLNVKASLEENGRWRFAIDVPK